jgi:hypothetical protein
VTITLVDDGDLAAYGRVAGRNAFVLARTFTNRRCAPRHSALVGLRAARRKLVIDSRRS